MPLQAASAVDISFIVWKRRSRSFESPFITTASTSGATDLSGARFEGGSGVSNMCLVSTPMKVSAWKGTSPVSIS